MRRWNRLIRRWWRCSRLWRRLVILWRRRSHFYHFFRLDHVLVLFIRARRVRVDLLELIANFRLIVLSSGKEGEIGRFGNLGKLNLPNERISETYFQVLAVFWGLVVVNLSEKGGIVEDAFQHLLRYSHISGRR